MENEFDRVLSHWSTTATASASSAAAISTAASSASESSTSTAATTIYKNRTCAAVKLTQNNLRNNRNFAKFFKQISSLLTRITATSTGVGWLIFVTSIALLTP